jgi:hypothetical protein
MATPKGMEVVRDAMLAEMAATESIKECSARDQGHLNYLFYAEKLSGAHVATELRGEGIVNTVG